MPSPTEEIKSKLDIVEFLRGYLEVTPAGKNFKARCPFHKEKTPSFMISPDRQTWHCFGCALGGDIFEFVMRYEHFEFSEALKVLADKAGVELRRVSPSDQKQFGILYDINESAAKYFEEQLKQSEVAQAYLVGRSFRGETALEFRVGFAPNVNDGLMVCLVKQGYDVRDVERAGLVGKSDRGTYFDRFRGRVMFPIFNHLGKIVGFTGRILPVFDTGNMGKYINSPETPIFLKSHVLYGLHKSREAIHSEHTALLVEGQMDFLMSWQDGVKNVVATSGTALTPDHLKVLKRHADKLVVSFDNDEAGIAAGERAIDMAMQGDFEVRVLTIHEGKDPADVVVAHPGKLAELVKSAVPAMRYYFDKYLAAVPKNEIGQYKRAMRAVLAKIKTLPSGVEQAHWLKELSGYSGFDEKILREEMANLKASAPKEKQPEVPTPELPKKPLTRIALVAERLLGLVTMKDGLKEKLAESADYLPLDYREICGILSGLTPRAPEGSSACPTVAGAELVSLISMRAGLEYANLPQEEYENEFQKLKSELKKEYFKEKSAVLLRRIKEAEYKGKHDEVEVLLAEFQKIPK